MPHVLAGCVRGLTKHGGVSPILRVWPSGCGRLDCHGRVFEAQTLLPSMPILAPIEGLLSVNIAERAVTYDVARGVGDETFRLPASLNYASARQRRHPFIES